jgi:hypothetical protein
MRPETEFDKMKTYNGQKYSGMKVGTGHDWDYQPGEWKETKVTPDMWQFSFGTIKRRHQAAPIGSGAPDGTAYHWYIVADQMVKKIDANAYETMMTGLKYKVGHKRPYWQTFSYKYPDQMSEKDRKIQFLKEEIARIEKGGST